MGGSTCLNAQLAFRGSPQDYDSWGAAGWTSEAMEREFKRIELRGGREPMDTCGMHVQLPNYQHELSRRFLGACGAKVHPDLERRAGFNDWSEKDGGSGFGRFELSQREGVRWTGASSYLAVAAARPNVTVLTGHTVTRVTLDSTAAAGGLAATGVTLREATVEARGETTIRLAAGGEVVLAAGALASPQLLQLSGIGEPSMLDAVGVPVRLALPAVGEGLQDHAAVTVAYESAIRDGLSEVKPLMPYLDVISPVALARWAFGGSGILATTFCDHGAFLRSDAALALPDVQLRFVPGIGPHPDGVKSYELLGKGVQHGTYGYTIQVINCRPKAVGSVQVVSSDPAIAPAIRCNYLSRQEDVRAIAGGIAVARELARAGPLGEVSRREVYPGAHVRSEAEVEAYIRGTAHSANGLSGGCCIGRVVDDQLRVAGVAGLRVADASVMPTIVGSQLALPTTAIAERAARLIASSGGAQSGKLAQ